MKIRIIDTGEIKEVSQGQISFLNLKGIAWEKFKNERVIASDIEMVAAYEKLSEGEKDRIRKGFKKLVLRKDGWILKDTENKAIEEIHISSPSVGKVQSKDSALVRAKIKMENLSKFKAILRNSVEGEDFYCSCEDSDKEEILEMIDSLSCGNSEVEILKAEIERLNKIVRTR